MRNLFSLTLLLSILFGLLLPDVAVLWKNYLNLFLALLMLFSALRVERFEKIDATQLLPLLFFIFVLMPLLSLPFRSNPLTFIGVLIAFSSPSAAATAFFVSFLGGDVALGLLTSFFSSLLSLITLPLTIQLLGGAFLPVDSARVLSLLIQVIALPILLAFPLRKFLPALTEKINKNRNFQLLFVFLLSSGMIGASHQLISENEYQLIQLTVSMLLLLTLGGALAYLFGRKYGKEAAVTFFIATSVKNAMLSFAVVLELFGIAAVFPMVANLLAQLLLMILLELFGSSLPQISARTR